MGDTACVMHPFSYASSAMSNELNQGNPMHVLGESVSFGRFVSESLAWEKWSTFSHNRYVEEAERYAQPGSVAQKKAFFEAHYKRIAAKKAAALLEQANAAAEAESLVTSPDNSVPHSQPLALNSTQQSPEPEDPKPESVIVILAANRQNSNQELMEPETPLETPMKKDSPNLQDNLEMASGSELSGTPQMEKPLLKSITSDQDVSSVKSKKKSAFSSFKSSVYRKTPKVPATPAKPVTPRIKKESNSSASATSAATPITIKSSSDYVEKKKGSTPKSLRTFINSTPAKVVLTPAANRKTENSRIVPDSCKASHHCLTTPLRTPDAAAKSNMSKHPAATTPCPANTRNETPVDGNKTTGPKWHILSAVCSKSLTARRNKLQSPTLSSTPLILRTEERAARRKQKLEEKFNSKELQKVQLQTKLKEKAESELRKLRRSFCFKARPLPEFYKERETQSSHTKKNPVTQSQSPKLGRKLSSRTMQGTMPVSLPPPATSLNKNGISKHVSGKNGRTATSFPASRPEIINHENASPNIPY
ncbi:protein WVD2-like 7 isoform X2 [Coffea eugenioides]|uniref:protein WVD2-like 7 isoform X2 n=1 Tax=Coffea eugenioides TaxID=49369 RepID=UPI000F609F56|nr:protein WVD2-like 7 isoform X2 [Coffea eugenioides]